MNVFRILADLSHTSSKCILIWAIHSNKSAEGVSLITQVLYFLVFITRYLDLFWTPPGWNVWNFVLKNFYIWSSIYIVYIMMRRYARTRERETAWRLAAYILAASAILGPICSVLYRVVYLKKSTGLTEILWAFSIVLESICVVPQLLLLRQTSVPTVIDSFYLVTLGAYRGLYVLNWIWRAASGDLPDAISVVFGVIQTLLYLDFAWVYWTRQRVKLRGGHVVDADDLNKGFLVNRFARQGTNSGHDDDPNDLEGGNTGTTSVKASRWGARGVSIRADDTLDHRDQSRGDVANESTSLTDPDHFLDTEEDDESSAAWAAHPSR